MGFQNKVITVLKQSRNKNIGRAERKLLDSCLGNWVLALALVFGISISISISIITSTSTHVYICIYIYIHIYIYTYTYVFSSIISISSIA